MPARVSFPAPSTWSCPLCDGPIAGPGCDRCRASFASPDGQTLWRVDHDLHDLCRIRNDVAERLLAGAPHPGAGDRPTAPLGEPDRSPVAVDPAAGPGSAGWTGAGVGPAPLPTDGVTPSAAPPGAVASHGPGWTPVPTAPPRTSPTSGIAGPPPAAAGAAPWWAPPPLPGQPWSPSGPAVPGRPGGSSPGIPSQAAGPAPGRPESHGWSAAEVLVAAGALSLVAAVAVFAAVAWDELAGTAKAGLLLGFTGLTAVVAGVLRRRGLRATAEAVGLVSVALGVADVQVVRVALDGAIEPHVVWAAGLAVVAAAAVTGGRLLRLRAVAAGGVALGCLPAVVLAGPVSAVAVAVALGATALLAIVVDRWSPVERLERVVLRVGGSIAWAAAVAVAGIEVLVRGVGDALDGSQTFTGPIVVLVGLAAVAVAGALVGRWSRSAQGLVLGASMVPALMGVLVAAVAGPAGPAGVVAWVLAAAVLIVVVAAELGGADRSRPWAAMAGTAAGAAGVLLVVPGVVVTSIAGRLLDEGVAAVESGRSVALATPVGADLDLGAWAGAPLVVQLLAVAALGVTAMRRRRVPEVGAALLVAAAVGVAVAGPVVAAVPLGVAVVAVLSLAVAATAARLWLTSTADGHLVDARPGDGSPTGPTGPELALGATASATADVLVADHPGDGSLAGPAGPAGPALALGVTAAAVGVGAVALLLALPSTPLVLLVASVLAVPVVGAAVDAFGRGAPTAPMWVGAAGSSVLAATVLGVARVGGSSTALVAVVAVVGVVLAAVGPLLEWAGTFTPRAEGSRRSGAEGDQVVASAAVADLVAAAAFGLALSAVPSPTAAAVVVAVAGVVAGLSSLRPTRPTAWRLSVAAAVVVTWIQLADAGVTVLEAYTLPLAMAVLVVAGWGRRPRGSWDRLGAGLALAVAPTVLLALAGDDLPRTAIALSVGVALAVWGAVGRLQAPLAIGCAAVGAVALRHLLPTVADLPRYLVLGTAGIVLLAIGATFEQRRADLRQARDAFTHLG